MRMKLHKELNKSMHKLYDLVKPSFEQLKAMEEQMKPIVKTTKSNGKISATYD